MFTLECVYDRVTEDFVSLFCVSLSQTGLEFGRQQSLNVKNVVVEGSGRPDRSNFGNFI